MNEHKRKKYVFVVLLSCEYDEDEDFSLFEDDLEQEIGCCWHGFEIEKIIEVTPKGE